MPPRLINHSTAMQPPVRMGDPSLRSSYWLHLGFTSPVRLPNWHAPRCRHGSYRGLYSGMSTSQTLSSAFAKTTCIGGFHRLSVPSRGATHGACPSARLHSYSCLLCQFRVALQRCQTPQLCDHLNCPRSIFDHIRPLRVFRLLPAVRRRQRWISGTA